VGSVQLDFTGLDFSSVPVVYSGGKMHLRLDFELRIKFGTRKGILEFSTWVNDKIVGSAEITYGN
jgi:hypothetical protein